MAKKKRNDAIFIKPNSLKLKKFKDEYKNKKVFHKQRFK